MIHIYPIYYTDVYSFYFLLYFTGDLRACRWPKIPFCLSKAVECLVLRSFGLGRRTLWFLTSFSFFVFFASCAMCYTWVRAWLTTLFCSIEGIVFCMDSSVCRCTNVNVHCLESTLWGLHSFSDQEERWLARVVRPLRARAKTKSHLIPLSTLV